MKARLPKALLSAIMCAFAYAATSTAQAGYVTPTTIWTEAGEMQLGNNPENISGYTLDVKDGDTEATISKNTETTSGLFVRDGKLTIGGTEEHITLTINPNGGGQLDDFKLNATGTILNVAGKDAVVIIDNATVTTDKKAVTAVGGPDGNGTLILQNGAKFDGSNQYYFFMGYKSYRLEGENPNYTGGTNNGEPIKQQVLHATTNNVGDSRADENGNADFSNRYEGTYTNGIGGTEYGKAVLIVTENSEFIASGINEFCMGEGELKVSKNSTFNTSEHYSIAALIGYGIGATSKVDIESGSVMNINGILWTGTYANSKAIINIDDATMNLKSDHYAFLGAWYDYENNGSYSELNLKNNAIVNTNCIVYVGLDADAKLTIDSTSTFKNMGADTNGALSIGAYGTVENKGTINVSALELDGGTLSHSGSLTVNNTLTLNSGVLEIVLTEANQSKEAITLADGATVTIGQQATTFKTRAASDDMVIRLVGGQNVKSGAKFIIFNQEVDLSAATIEGVDIDLKYVDGETVITLQEDIYVGRDSQADALGAAAWGVQKSSQAFTGTLWSGRTNAVVLNTPAAKDNKAKPAGQTLAWGTAYGSFDRQSSCGNKAGADYSIYGGAMGVEHQFVSGRSIGGAIGYDWGKVSPFNVAKFDQESMHAAVYGRAGQWKLGQNGTVALDLSAAVGSTESELSAGDLDQDNLQLDARVSYIRRLSDKLSASVFAGAQYYAQDDASAARVAVSSMQNLRTMAGAGITYAATAKTTLFAEASVHNDAMRHNPVAEVDGFRERVANPGRLGGSITAGAAYQMNENWTLRGSYSFEGAKHSTEHNVNAGAVYRF